MADPKNTLIAYDDLSPELKDTLFMMSCWVGLAKLYYGFFCLGTALSSEPIVRIVGAAGACFTSYMSFTTLIPAFAKLVDMGTLDFDVTAMLKAPLGVIGTLFGFAAYLEYKEMKEKGKKE